MHSPMAARINLWPCGTMAHPELRTFLHGHQQPLFIAMLQEAVNLLH
jgi:hypothetical protein